MPKVYLGFSIADSMFEGSCFITREEITQDKFKELAGKGVVSYLNRLHKGTIEELRSRFKIKVSIPRKPLRIKLEEGDSIIVVSLRGPQHRQDTNHHYSREELSDKTFGFALWTRHN